MKEIDGRMSSYTGKQLLSLIRDGDYAHAGEEHAIELLMGNVQKNSANKVLDVGCGIGGTADYVQRNGWGSVTGVDIDAEAVHHANVSYDRVDFHTVPVEKLSSSLKKKFNILYLFNSFYVFENHSKALEEMAKVSESGATLLIFDYYNKNGFEDPSSSRGENVIIPNPVNIDNLDTFKNAGWKLEKVKDISELYIGWYISLLSEIDRKRNIIVSKFSKKKFDYLRRTYQDILNDLKQETLGGIIIVAHQYVL